MNKEEAEEFYKTHEFYEVVNGKKVGPLDNIFILDPNVDRKDTEYEGFKYCQVIDGRVVAAFKEGEIIVKKVANERF